MIRFEHVSKSYQKGIPALNDISLHIAPGEFVFITGPSGSGKSTMIKLLLDEFPPTKGKLLVNGKNLARITHRDIPLYRRNIGCVFQDFQLLPDRNVYENVAFAMKVVEAPSKKIKKEVPQVLSMVGLAAKYRSFPNELSGGEQQRVAIARALVNRPRILLADEPTGNLDDENAHEIMKLLDKINQRGTTVLVVTHNLNIVREMNRRAIRISKGTVVSDQSPEDEEL